MNVALKNQFITISYNEKEQSIYVKEKQDITRVFENKSKDEFNQFKNSKQHDYFYSYILKTQNHKIISKS